MNLSLRQTIIVSLIAVGVAIASRQSFWGKPTPKPGLEKGTILLVPASEDTIIVSRRINAKTCVVEKLYAGELTLLEAAAWFHRLNHEPPTRPDLHWERIPGDTPSEKICRQVIRWTEAALSHKTPASELALITCRLEDELQRLLAQNDQFVLPDFAGEN